MILFALVFLFVAIWQFFKWSHSYWARKDVCGPAGLPLFGSMFQYFIRRKHFGVIYDEIYRAYPYAQYVGFYKFGTPSILVRNMDLARTILVDNFSAFANNDVKVEPALDPLLIKNPFYCDEKEWKQSRAQIGAIYSAAKVRQVMPLVAEVCDQFVRFVADRLDEDHEAKQISHRYAVESVASCGFGVEAETFTNRQSEFMEYAKKMFHMSTFRAIRFRILQFLPILRKWFKMSFFPHSSDDWLRGMVHHVTEHRRRSLEHRHDFLQVLLDARVTNPTEFDADSVTGHALSLLIDGTEKSSTAMSYLLYELARNPIVQERIQADIEEFLGDEPITDEALHKMQYLEMAVYETLRMHSVLLTMIRMTTRDVTLPPQFAGDDNNPSGGGGGGGVVIPKGTPIILPVYSWHKDPALFENPDAFVPERFREVGRAERHHYGFLGFGDGPRICPGIRFGMVQVKAAIVATLRNYNVRLSDRTLAALALSPTVVLRTSTTGIWVRFERRIVDDGDEEERKNE